MAGLKLVLGVVFSLLAVISAEWINSGTHPDYPGFYWNTTFRYGGCIYKAQKGDTMKQDYVGTLIDGTEFDESYKRGRTFNFRLWTGAVIRGMDMGMNGMCKHEKRTIIIPPELGYGTRGIAGLIPSNATLIFKVVLTDLEVNKISTEIVTPMECTHNAHDGDTVTIKIIGRTIDGKKFMDEVKTFVLGKKVEIVGVEQSMRGMCVGEKRRFTIPGEKAYRKAGRQGVGPWASVIDEVELLKLVRPELTTKKPKKPVLKTEKPELKTEKPELKSEKAEKPY